MTGAVAFAAYSKDEQASVVDSPAMSIESLTEKGIPKSSGSRPESCLSISSSARARDSDSGIRCIQTALS
jgi:hypothetical protein